MHSLFIYLSVSFAIGIVCNYYVHISFIYLLLLIVWMVPSLFLYRNENKFLCAISVTFFLLGMTYEGVYHHLPDDHISYYRSGKYALIGVVDSAVLYNTHKKIQYGDKLKIWGQLEKPSQATNPGQFDYQDYLKKYSIYMLLRSYGDKGVHVYSHGHRNSIIATILNARNTIKKKIDGALPYPFNTLLAALLLGFRSEIPSYIRDNFVKTGTVHLLAISGLHISIVTAAIYYFLTIIRINRFIRAGMSVVFMLMYTALAGFRFPVQRAALMGSLIIVGMVLDRRKNIKNIFFLAFLILIMITPESLFLAGFQLSFITVFSIIILTPLIMNMFLHHQENGVQHCKNWGARARRYILTGYAV